MRISDWSSDVCSADLLGAGEWMVVEADESDGTFLKLPATIAVVTNIDPEHLDHYGTFDKVRDGFKQFVESIPFYGFAALCIDHPEVQAMIGRRSEEHTSELQSLMRNSYAVFCLKKKTYTTPYT